MLTRWIEVSQKPELAKPDRQYEGRQYEANLEEEESGIVVLEVAIAIHIPPVANCDHSQDVTR